MGGHKTLHEPGKPKSLFECAISRIYADSAVSAHGTRLFYERLSCGEPCGRMGRGGWPAMRSLQQWMASLRAARRIFLSRSKPTRKMGGGRLWWALGRMGGCSACHSPVAWANAKATANTARS